MRIKLFHRNFVDDEGTVYPELVYEFTTGDEFTTDVMHLDEVFCLFNCYPYREHEDKLDPSIVMIDHRYFSAIVEYRNEGHRSLSAGDVVQIEDVFFELLPKGWRTIIPCVSACGRQLEY